MNLEQTHTMHRETAHRLARRALFSFVLTFVVARAIVLLIMARLIPNLYLFLQDTHIHHLNYGIFLLAAVGGYTLFFRPVGRAANIAALVYGAAMALTFDEFGMWLHLGGSYWQRVSVDIVLLVIALLALIGFGRSVERFESRHFWAFIFVALAVCAFGFVLFAAGDQIGDLVGPRLHELELLSMP
jgi:hypothetical protein